MLLFPLATFYGFFYLIFKKDPKMLGWSGIAAVVAANLVIFAYVRMAWYEKDPEGDLRDEARRKAKRSD